MGRLKNTVGKTFGLGRAAIGVGKDVARNVLV
jgi:hypothetical protein